MESNFYTNDYPNDDLQNEYKWEIKKLALGFQLLPCFYDSFFLANQTNSINAHTN